MGDTSHAGEHADTTFSPVHRPREPQCTTLEKDRQTFHLFLFTCISFSHPATVCFNKIELS